MNPMLRLDGAIARYVAWRFSKDRSGIELMPWPKQEEPVATLDDFMSILKPKNKAKK